MYGTDRHGVHIEDYCVYCYKDGRFTSDVTMNEMIRLCARFVEGNSHDLAIANMKMYFPTLKRWARKENTQHEYYKSITRVLQYIQEHLEENTDLKTLAGIACISPYHFHRIFKATIGESLAEYVQRLRLEYVAEQLKISGLSLGELAERTGYSSEQALSRAFKRYFSLPPKAFKKSFFEDRFGDKTLKPRICKVAARNAIRLREGNSEEKNWQKLYMYAIVNRLLFDTTESLEVMWNGDFYPALTVRELPRTNNHIHPVVLPEGLYAIFTHKGEIGKIVELYEAVRNYWLPTAKYILAGSMPYIVYLSNSMDTPPEEFLSELYLPVVEKNDFRIPQEL